MQDSIYYIVEGGRCMFGVACIGNGVGVEVASLAGLKCDDNGRGAVGTCEEKGVNVAIMIGCMCKKVGVDGVEFDVYMAV